MGISERFYYATQALARTLARGLRLTIARRRWSVQDVEIGSLANLRRQ